MTYKMKISLFEGSQFSLYLHSKSQIIYILSLYKDYCTDTKAET